MDRLPTLSAHHDWTVITLTRNGMWSVASDRLQSQAISEAIRVCQADSRPLEALGLLPQRANSYTLPVSSLVDPIAPRS